MATTRIPPDFKEFLRLLHSHGVEYLLIGGYAVGYHGYPRPTGDLDIWVATTPANAIRLGSALREFGFDTGDLSTELAATDGRILRMGVPPVRLEIMTKISGVEFQKCYEQRIVDTFEGVPLSIINVADLRANKQAAKRKKDLADLDYLP